MKFVLLINVVATINVINDIQKINFLSGKKDLVVIILVAIVLTIIIASFIAWRKLRTSLPHKKGKVAGVKRKVKKKH